MLTDHLSVTRLPDYLAGEHLRAVMRTLCDEREDGEYPLHAGLETVGDLRAMGRDAFLSAFPALEPAAVDWLFEKIARKRKPGRPRKGS